MQPYCLRRKYKAPSSVNSALCFLELQMLTAPIKQSASTARICVKGVALFIHLLNISSEFVFGHEKKNTCKSPSLNMVVPGSLPPQGNTGRSGH